MQATAMLGQNRKNSNRANSSAVRPLTDIRQCYIAHLAASRIFFKQLANRHDAHAAKIISVLQN